MIYINKRILSGIKKHALQDSPRECCGMCVRKKNKIQLFKCKNIAQNPLTHFEICPKDTLRAFVEFDSIVAYYHSHCLPEQQPEFTPFDSLVSNYHGIPAILYHMPSDTFKFAIDGKYDKYLGRTFNFGVTDCLSLVQDFYINEFGFKIPEIERKNNWYEINPRIIEKEFRQYGFQEIKEKDSPQYGDILVLQFPNRGYPSHFMIYIGNDEILHHRFNGYSTIERYTEQLKEMTFLCLRKKEC